MDKQQSKIVKQAPGSKVRVTNASQVTTELKTRPNPRLGFLKFCIWFGALAVLFFCLLNWGFVTARVSYFFYKPDPATVIQPVKKVLAPNEGSWPKNVLAIPSLGVSAPIQYIEHADDATMQDALAHGVVHYPGSSLPGQVGNMYIFGHSSDYAWAKGDFKHVFALLPKIALGAEIKITDSQGYAYTYLVTERKVVGPQDVAVLSQNTAGKRLLTVQTSYPIGTALKRYVVVAELRQSD